MRAYLNDCLKNNISKTAGGKELVTFEKMEKAALKFIEVLRKTAESCDLAPSVQALFDTLGYSEPHMISDGSAGKPGKYIMYIYFHGDLHRDSLVPGSYDGVDNIVALLNVGCTAADSVYGVWKGHYSGYNKDCRSSEAGDYIKSLAQRPGLQFMQQAVRDFEGNYGSDYGVEISLNPVYGD